MKQMQFALLRTTFALLATVILVNLAPARHAAVPPNIILVMPDDVGYGDYACLRTLHHVHAVGRCVHDGERAVHAIPCQSDLLAAPCGADERAA